MPRGVYVRTFEMREAIRKARIGKKASHETKQKLSEIGKIKARDPEWIKLISERTAARIRDPEIRDRHLRGLSKAIDKHGVNFKGGNGQEPVAFVKVLEQILLPAGFTREYAIGIFGHSGNYKVDFAHVEGKIAIEVDGPKHWPQKQKEFDRKKTAILNGLGWRVIRVNHL